MNYLVIEEQCITDSKAVIKDQTANNLIKEHDLKSGITISALIYNGKRGKTFVVEASDGYLELDLDLSEEVLNKNDIHVVVGLCRPQTVKKVIQASLSLGVKSLDFVLSETSEKSYLTSKIWEPENLKREIILGMSQSGDSIAPDINLFNNFKSFFEKELLNRDYFQSSAKLIALTESTKAIGETNQDKPLILVIGPEKGWSKSEVESLHAMEFQTINLGPRVFRTDQAFLSLVARYT